MQLTLQFPIECSSEVTLVLQNTLSQYTDSYNRVCQVGWGMETLNGVELHKLTYYPEREQTDLPAQLVCSARVKATESLKAARTRLKKKQKASCPNSKSSSIRYDARSATIDLVSGIASLASISGRQKVKLKVHPHYQPRIGWKVCSSDLCLHKNKKFYLHVVVEKDIPVASVLHVVGVDLGVNRPAVTSRADFFGKKSWKGIEWKYFKLKRELQAKGTDSAKRHLKRLSQKVHRFRNDCDHVLSKKLATTYGSGTLVVMEDLTDIRTRVQARRFQRRAIHSWSFARLKFYVSYKTELYGGSVGFVDPHYTSQKCNCCGFTAKANRVIQSEFKCKKCGFQQNADLNAAKNIRDNHIASKGISVAGGVSSTTLL
jgi:IS605 OrfB family transposase